MRASNDRFMDGVCACFFEVRPNLAAFGLCQNQHSIFVKNVVLDLKGGGGRKKVLSSNTSHVITSQTTSSTFNNNQDQDEKTKIRYQWAKNMLNWEDGSYSLITREEFRTNILYSLFIFITSFIIYVKTQYPDVSGGDAGELIITAHQLGIAHPPGYPLFTMFGHFFDSIIPFGTVAWKVSTMSSFFGAICSSVIYLVIKLWINDNWCGMVSAYLFTFSPLIWCYQIQGEVFSINNLFVALIMLMSVWYVRVRIYEDQVHNTSFWTSERIGYLSAFVCGLGLTNQHTLVVIVAPFAFWLMLIGGRDQFWTTKSLANMSLCALAGLSPYLYLFVSPRVNKVQYSWGNTATVSGFITHFLRQEYGTLQLYSGDSGTTQLIDRIILYFTNLSDQFSTVGVVFALIGLLSLLLGSNFKSFQSKSIGTMILFTFTFYVTFFFNLCNLPIEKPLYKGVFLRFFMQPNVIISLAIGVGLKSTFNIISKYNQSIKKYLLPIVSIVMIIYQIQLNYWMQDQSDNYSFRDYGHAILQNLPPNAILLVGGDLVTNVPQYLKLCHGVRTDVDIISLEVMSWDWFTVTQGPVYKNVIFPGRVYHPNLYDGFSLKTFLDSNQHRPVFISGDFKYGDNSFQQHYYTLFRGFSSQILPVNVDRHHYQIILKEYEKYPIFKLPNDTAKWPEDSWEYFLVNDVATHLEKGAENLLSTYLKESGEESDNALRLSIKMLTHALEIRAGKCWALKHLGLSYDHLRYRIMNNQSTKNPHSLYEKYTQQLHYYWGQYIDQCAHEKDQDWATIKSVIQTNK
ncbi:transmembrane protein [Cavenderia fasciculata]|uniref:Transmembrane protein n=1 Tax=Cavenderia fasciculata TaxID=261658 RepID=F4PSR0_CACFS|nr:uncharacterized protein DFA_01424 [Cavenderia fasciculata]EGG21538.1 transmembrane protein [Cavenderia fasciculata]|eukprot:XP_004359388.1 transmembrane protein [Cavenderia fasciculata]